MISSIEQHIDDETTVTHRQLADKVENVLESSEKVAELLKKPKVMIGWLVESWLGWFEELVRKLVGRGVLVGGCCFVRVIFFFNSLRRR